MIRVPGGVVLQETSKPRASGDDPYLRDFPWVAQG